MGKFFAGIGAALLFMTAGMFVWQAQADKPSPVPPAPAATGAQSFAGTILSPPPTATEQTREQKRFARYDKDRNGAVARGEYLAGRQKGFAKLDTNGDGRLSLDEYAVKAVTKFAGADADRNGALNAGEFATTRVVRKAAVRPKCAPGPRSPPEDVTEES